jgi:hypothetical protein
MCRDIVPADGRLVRIVQWIDIARVRVVVGDRWLIANFRDSLKKLAVPV